MVSKSWSQSPEGVNQHGGFRRTVLLCRREHLAPNFTCRAAKVPDDWLPCSMPRAARQRLGIFALTPSPGAVNLP